jgi:hypothetical protein
MDTHGSLPIVFFGTEFATCVGRFLLRWYALCAPSQWLLRHGGGGSAATRHLKAHDVPYLESQTVHGACLHQQGELLGGLTVIPSFSLSLLHFVEKVRLFTRYIHAS